MAVKTYAELVAWLEENNVSPEDARVAAQVEVVNVRNLEPSPCPKCGHDLNNGTNHVVTDGVLGDAYYCPKCNYLVQVG